MVRGRTLPIQSRKKRSRSPADSKNPHAAVFASEESAAKDDASATNYNTVSSSEDEAQAAAEVLGIDCLLTAAAKLESPKKKNGVQSKNSKTTNSSKKKMKSVTPSEAANSANAAPAATNTNDPTEITEGAAVPHQRIDTLLHAATSVPNDGVVVDSNRPVTRSSSKNKDPPATATAATAERPTKRQATAAPPAPIVAPVGNPAELMEDVTVRPRGSRPGDELFYPTADELKEATTRRSRNALFSWYDRLRDLYNYKAAHGDCMVPQKYPPNHALGIWVNKQRMEKRLSDQGLKSTMNQHRLNLLNQAGFHWAKSKGQVSWDSKYQELVEFHRAHGHCNVPTKFRANSALGRWISTQRAQMKEWRRGEKTSMTQERYAKLCALDFQFERLKTTKKGGENESLVDLPPPPPATTATAQMQMAVPPAQHQPQHQQSLQEHKLLQEIPMISQQLPAPPPLEQQPPQHAVSQNHEPGAQPPTSGVQMPLPVTLATTGDAVSGSTDPHPPPTSPDVPTPLSGGPNASLPAPHATASNVVTMPGSNNPLPPLSSADLPVPLSGGGACVSLPVAPPATTTTTVDMPGSSNPPPTSTTCPDLPMPLPAGSPYLSLPAAAPATGTTGAVTMSGSTNPPPPSTSPDAFPDCFAV